MVALAVERDEGDPADRCPVDTGELAADQFQEGDLLFEVADMEPDMANG